MQKCKNLSFISCMMLHMMILLLVPSSHFSVIFTFAVMEVYLHCVLEIIQFPNHTGTMCMGFRFDWGMTLRDSLSRSLHGLLFSVYNLCFQVIFSSSHRPCWCAAGTAWSWAPRLRHAHQWPCTAADTGWVWPGWGCAWACAVPPPPYPKAPRSAPPTRGDRTAPPPELRPHPLPKHLPRDRRCTCRSESLIGVKTMAHCYLVTPSGCYLFDAKIRHHKQTCETSLWNRFLVFLIKTQYKTILFVKHWALFNWHHSSGGLLDLSDALRKNETKLLNGNLPRDAEGGITTPN